MSVFNRHQQRNAVEQLVEEYTHFKITRRQFMQRAVAVGLSTSAAVSLLEACGGTSTSGVSSSATPATVKSIDMLVVISGSELADLNEVNAAFTQKTGIKVNVESTRDLPTVLNTRVRGNNPPDVSAIPDLPSIKTYASEGKLLRLDTFMDMNTVRANYSSTWLDLVTVNGGIYAVPFLANTKGTIWYSPKQFSANGWSVPKTWNDMITLSNQIAAKGLYPWSLGVESGAASGWPASDWIDQIYFTLNGPAMSAKWVNHQIPWTDSSVKNAFTYFGQIIQGKHYINGAPQSILATNFQPASYLPFDSPPKAYMYYLGDFTEGFITAQFPGLKAGTDFNFFPWPTINPAYAGAITGTADIYFAMKDNNGTRQYMEFLTTAEAQEIWVKKGGKSAVNKSVPTSAYPDPVAAATAAQLQSATAFTFSQDDSMPTAMENAYWKATLSYIQNPSSLDSILSSLESTATSVYSS
ncbi:MAG TPA: extracellular solute-binding protein [Ktedonobacteraceae bacterium]|nr:extracellular solute-binding protein [Ktedonobacteraceae bacterium]